MKMEPLKSGVLKIWMGEEEMQRWGLTPKTLEAGDEPAYRALTKWLDIAEERFNFTTRGGAKVEVLPFDSGYLFLVIPEAQAGAHTVCVPQIYAIADENELLRLGENLTAVNARGLPLASLYRFRQEYRLITYMGRRKQSSVRRVLSEFAQLVEEGAGAAAFLEEHGTPIIRGIALHRLREVYESR